MDKRHYMERLSEQIRYKKALPLIQQELDTHIEEQKADFMAAGMEGKEAEAAAVLEMGDPVEVGVQMDELHRPKSVSRLAGWICFLMFSGFLLQFLVSRRLYSEFMDAALSWSFSEIYGVCLGCAALLCVCRLDYSRIGKRAKELTVGLFLLLCVGILLCGREVNGSAVSIYVAGISVNVKIIILLFLPLYGGILYQHREEGRQAVLKCLLWMLPGVLLAWRCPSPATTLLLLSAEFLMLLWCVRENWFCVNKRRTLGLLAGGAALSIAAVFLYIFRFGNLYQWERLKILCNPFGMTEINPTMNTLREAVWHSRFVGSSEMSLKLLQEGGGVNFFDYGLAYLVSFYGVLAAVLLIGVMLMLFRRLLVYTLRQKNHMGRILGVGCLISLTAQTLLYLASNLGGSLYGSGYCPFLGRGCSGALVTGIFLGLLLSVIRYQNVVAEPQIYK